MLQLAKDQFNRIPLGRIAYVIYPTEAQISHDILRLIGSMDIKLIHEDADLVCTSLFLQFTEPLLELGDIHGLGVDVVMLMAAVHGYTCQHCQCRLLEASFVDRHVLPW